MDETGTYSIQIGEHGIAGVAAHLSVRFVNNDTGERIIEINGLATDRSTGEIRAVGVPWRDDIEGHIWASETTASFWNTSRTRSTDTIATKPLSELETDIRTVIAVVDAVNSKGITYNPIGTNSNSFAFDLLAGLGYSRADVRAIVDRLTPGARLNLLTDQEIRDIRDSIAGDGAISECFGPDTAIDMWPLDPEFAPDPRNPNKIFDQDAVRAKIWKKPIVMIRKGDVVVSFDKNDNLMPGRVTRTFENDSKILLDCFGTRVTPGHVYFRPDSEKADKFECLLDILRDDGMIQNVEGKNIRAATNVPVGDPRDGFVWAITQERKDGFLVEKERGRIRLGTRFIVDGKTSQCVADVIAAKGGTVGDDELIRVGDAAPAPFVWEHGATLPKPEDFVLLASGTTLIDIYKAGEWESRRPQMPAPMVMDGGPVQPLSATAHSAMPRNQPLGLTPSSVLSRTPSLLMRFGRRAAEVVGRVSH
ncbi:hypothetical protein [uncultured Roseobacter sp.]|uniref:hypothetical protein n=1 Tax=uncultured Roseobacter sp. TaxID=114847 RepID=UPI002625E93E|nr:hypothetical protein [uncultured Roseobacter sp.]